MSKTEEEARKCWCPATRRDAPVEVVSCIASECMAWRWSYRYEPPPGEPENTSPRTGYCGLAGAVFA